MTEKPRICPIRYARLGYATLRVTRLTDSVHFYTDLLGLTLARSSQGCAWLRCSDKPYDLILEQGEVAGVRRIGFQFGSVGDLTTAFDHVSSLGLHPVWSGGDMLHDQRVAAAFRFVNPDTGLELDFYAQQQSADSPYTPTVAKIERLGHVVFNVRSYAAAHRFWVDQLGFAISDHVPGRIAFLRCYPNPLHHTLALLTGPADGLNHVNFMVTDIDDIGLAMNRMKRAGVPIVFGPGRHLPSGSIFLYFLDPDGMTAEYSFGMERIPATNGRAPRELEPKPEVLDTWGSVADPRFGKTGAIVGASA
jgi:2,3-dihydroxy-p-cumate/2,3-dihydroxybenzoate 3,4-dioxygenase